MITYEEAKEWLSYNPETGVVTWLKRRSNNTHQGDVAGDIDIDGYRKFGFNRKTYKVHRVAWLMVYQSWPSNQVDHINGDRLDNRLCNLRDVTISLNAQNRSGHRSGRLLGATLHKQSNKWQSQIRINGKPTYLGAYTTELEAHQRYLSALAEYNLTNQKA